MSYAPNRENESMFITAWSAVDVAIPSKTSGGVDTNPNYTFNIDTQGIGDRVVLASDVLTSPDNIQTFWLGDIRSETDNTTEQNNFSIAFANSNGADSTPPQEQRRSFCGDITYSLYPNAELTMFENSRSGGDALALYVRVLGLLVGDMS